VCALAEGDVPFRTAAVEPELIGCVELLGIAVGGARSNPRSSTKIGAGQSVSWPLPVVPVFRLVPVWSPAALIAASRFAATSSRSSSNKSAYTSSVMLAIAWPSIRWTALTLAPAMIARLAAVWRRSCGVIVGNSGVVAWPVAATWSILADRSLELVGNYDSSIAGVGGYQPYCGDD
jgi:hypothetical protein